MNCHDFEATAGELAAGRLMDAAQREEALAHAAACASCASRLEDEQSLTAGFQFVAKMSVEDAPARVESRLLEAFRQNSTRSAVGRPRTWARWYYVAASAAAIALIAALIALVATRTREAQQPALQKAINPPAVPEAPRPAVPQQQASLSSPETVVASQRYRPERVGKGSKSRRQPNRVNRSTGDAEIATDFIPLMNRETLAQMDGGQIMRVELPRSALMSFGLPMDMERAAERIKADVVVGNDGLARAIRFVR
jgi:hypothetical protein